MSSIVGMNPSYGGGYILPRHVHIRPSNVADLADGHVAPPSGDPRFGLVNGQPLQAEPLFPAVAIATKGTV